MSKRELRALNEQNQIALWSERVKECRSSSQNVKTWCQEHEISIGTYYKWQKRLFEMSQVQQEAQQPAQQSEMQFVEVTSRTIGQDIAISVQIGKAEAHIHNGADAGTVQVVLQILKSC